MKNLEQIGVQEMDTIEMKTIDGGKFLGLTFAEWGAILTTVVIAIAIIVIL